MIDPKIFDNVASTLAGVLPKGAQQMQGELEKNFRAILQSKLAKLDLVTREEFDVQTAVLQRTRSKLDALERQVAELEQRIK